MLCLLLEFVCLGRCFACCLVFWLCFSCFGLRLVGLLGVTVRVLVVFAFMWVFGLFTWFSLYFDLVVWCLLFVDYCWLGVIVCWFDC